MPGSVYKVIELVGTSTESWEDAARGGIQAAARTLQDLRVAEVVQMDARLDKDAIIEYRVKLKVSFKHHQELADD